jgi:N-acylneuraminate cytidylyltransferase/CMP-N,N'-diacetyllegionaminic acid synthase
MDYHPWWAMRVVRGRLMPFFSVKKLNTERHSLPEAWRESGGIYVTKRDVLMNMNRLRGPDTRPIFLDSISSLDIDDEMDFLFAESIARSRGVLQHN